MSRQHFLASLSVLALLSAPALAAVPHTAPDSSPNSPKPQAEKPAAAEAPVSAKDAATKKEAAPVATTPEAKAPVDPVRLREEAFARGKRAYDRGDWMKAIADLRPLAEYGDVRGMMLLGNMYQLGNGVGVDMREAFSLYHRAAMAGSTDGMVAIAAMYQAGIGVSLNTRLAIGWFERAARMGDQSGAFFFAIHNFQGSKGTTYDMKADTLAAYKWFRIAATNGENKRIRNSAFKLCLKLEEKLPPDKVIEVKKEVDTWAPDTLDELGPDPEAVLAKEMKEKGIQPEPEQATPAPAPDAQPAPPAPEKAPEQPAEKPAEAPKP
jgi:TPR repeat protein